MKELADIIVELAKSITQLLTNMNELLNFFIKGLMITFLIVLGLFLLKKIGKILA
jgi:hypothetical protein